MLVFKFMANDYIGKLYKNLTKYVKMDVKPEHLEDINNNVAEIRWVIAHATPWERGSDSIANVFIRSIYKALGVKATPLKKRNFAGPRGLLYKFREIQKEFS